MLPSHHLQLDDCGCCCCCVFLLTPPPGTYEWSRSVLSWKSQSLNFPMGEFDWVSGFVHAIGRYGLVIGYWMGSIFFNLFFGGTSVHEKWEANFCLGGKSEVDHCCWRWGGEAWGYQPAKMIKKGGVMVYHSLGPPTDRKANIINAFWVT
jgi:hypothetical protein